MGSDLEKDLERGIDPEKAATSTESIPHSGVEKETISADHGALGVSDPDHEEVEQMDLGHLDDLATQHASPPIQPHTTSAS